MNLLSCCGTDSATTQDSNIYQVALLFSSGASISNRLKLYRSSASQLVNRSFYKFAGLSKKIILALLEERQHICFTLTSHAS